MEEFVIAESLDNGKLMDAIDNQNSKMNKTKTNKTHETITNKKH